MNSISFFVSGLPQPAGSKRGFAMKRKGMGWTDANGKFAGRVIITDANAKSRDWKGTVSQEAAIAMASVNLPFERPVLTGPLELCVTFQMPRIKGHYRSNGELKPGAPKFHTVRPDATKLLRGVEDALTGIVWADDSQIARQTVEKIYADKAGARITITPLEQPKSEHWPKRKKQTEVI